jgi:hypothetical protein
MLEDWQRRILERDRRQYELAMSDEFAPDMATAEGRLEAMVIRDLRARFSKDELERRLRWTVEGMKSGRANVPLHEVA